MAICKKFGYPDLFITMTCNTNWAEIKNFVKARGQRDDERPDILCRVFKMRLDQLMTDLKKEKVFGYTDADIDMAISAELPDPDLYPEDRTIIAEDGYPRYRRRRNDVKIQKNGIEIDNTDVVPYNPFLLMRYKAHINVEYCNKTNAIKYLPPCEAIWRIHGFFIHSKWPSDYTLEFHLPNDQSGRIWTLRKQGVSIGRLRYIPPDSEELFYMRVLLTIQRGYTSFESIRTIKRVLYNSYQAACDALGLLTDDKENVDGITEAKNLDATSWRRCILYERRRSLSMPDLRIESDELQNLCLVEIEKLLNNNGRFVTEFEDFEHPDNAEFSNYENKFIVDELNYDKAAQAKKHLSMLNSLNADQREQGSLRAKLLQQTRLIIWDDAPMLNRYCFEALDRTLRDLLAVNDLANADKPFGGIVVVLGGDFSVLKLSQNMRLTTSATSEDDLEEIREFADWILKIGDSCSQTNESGEYEVTIPDELLIKESGDPLQDFAYPELLTNLENTKFFEEQAILCPTLDGVQMVNDYILSTIPGHETEYLSADKTCISDEDADVPGLCNGTRLNVKELLPNVIGATIITGTNAREDI
ncbi:uncharacterized protein LOC130712471 [Lotus japonicus]|uniref:uncharacterized protein LOC130712471 n=1 Tax=Lotus japonicus TaxID=34305 RepID=UPI00258E720D|nr:uncharacterized protein LOC130712471 [Lotus japonicus]